MQCFWRRRNSCVESSGLFQTPSSSSSSNGTVVRFGFLVEMADPLILGSVALAVDSVNGDDTILKGVKLDFFFERIHSESHKVVFTNKWYYKMDGENWGGARNCDIPSMQVIRPPSISQESFFPPAATYHRFPHFSLDFPYRIRLAGRQLGGFPPPCWSNGDEMRGPSFLTHMSDKKGCHIFFTRNAAFCG